MDESTDQCDLMLLYHYGELDPRQHERMRRMLDADPAARGQYDALLRDLRRVQRDIERHSAAAEPAQFASRLHRRIAAQLGVGHGEREVRSSDAGGSIVPLRASGALAGQAGAEPAGLIGAAAGGEGSSRLRPPGPPATDSPAGPRLAWTALAASVVLFVAGVSFEAGRYSRPQAGGAPTQAGTEWTPSPRERVLLAEVQRHLGASERLLVDVSNGTALGAAAEGMDGDALAAEQEWARTLLLANRLYRFAAVRSGQTRIAELLRDLEPILIELANGTLADSPQYAAVMRESIESGGLLHRVRAVRRGTNAGVAGEDSTEGST